MSRGTDELAAALSARCGPRASEPQRVCQAAPPLQLQQLGHVAFSSPLCPPPPPGKRRRLGSSASGNSPQIT
ncbi:Hypothetical predicted protein [Podarcis lilfordi]|uniref:Uncharacterized protein n=1 Tax=Podarcis lilfordi TaxID=74358 RepID=A0AA35KCH4_9SAUR|nr:Hypothetical predicted protein [Podarcis lilfordi]